MLKANWTVEQADFIKNNLEYLYTSAYTSKWDIISKVYFNKFCNEECNDIITDDYDIQICIGENRISLFSIHEIHDYNDFKNHVIDGLKRFHLTLHEYRELANINMLGCNTKKWYKYTKDNGISFTLQSDGDLLRILTFMEKIITGDENSYEKVYKEYRYKYGYQINEFTFRDMVIKTFRNGRVDIRNCPKEVIDKFFRYEQLILQIYPDKRYNYKKFVEENKPTKVLEEYLC